MVLSMHPIPAPVDCPRAAADEGTVCTKVGAALDEAPKPPAEPNAGADCPNVDAAAVLLLEPKLNAGMLLGAVLLLPPKLKVELLAGAAVGACAALLLPKAKLGVELGAEAPKPNVDELLGADAVLVCPKAIDGVLLAVGTAAEVWLAPKPNAGVALLVGFAVEPKLKGAVAAMLLG